MESTRSIGAARRDVMPQPATVLLVRHGHTAAVGCRLVGRLPGVELTDEGRRQAQRLVERLASLPLSAIYSSPLERALETARPLAAARTLEIIRCDELIEMDFGEWTGQTFEALDRLPEWQRFNSARGRAEVPGGESAAAVQRRAIRAVEAIAARHAGATVAAFTHADVIRSILLHHTGRPLDQIHDFEAAPASVTAIAVDERGTDPLITSTPHRSSRRALLPRNRSPQTAPSVQPYRRPAAI